MMIWGSRWTPEEEALLRRLWLTATVAELRQLYARGRGPRACSHKARRLGLGLRPRRPRPWSEDEVRRLHRMRVVERLPDAQIAAVLGRTCQAVTWKAAATGASRRRNPVHRCVPDHTQVAQLVKQGLTYKQAGEQLGISREAVAGRVYRHYRQRLPVRHSPPSLPAVSILALEDARDG